VSTPVVLITGALKGIGRATAIAFAIVLRELHWAVVVAMIPVQMM
jgi:NAD(P)-dependent dehydrogenase (short-subunit alcohol dehydrogenase family)